MVLLDFPLFLLAFGLFWSWKPGTPHVLFDPFRRSKNTPLARNQYINNSPGIFSCTRAGANTGATCIRTDMKSLKNLANMRKMIPREYFPVFARVRIQALHVFAQKLIPQEFFPACIGFVPGGTTFLKGECRILTHEYCKTGEKRQEDTWFHFSRMYRDPMPVTSSPLN